MRIPNPTRLIAAADAPGSLSARARRRRWELVTGHFPDLADMRVADLGGSPDHWIAAPVRPARVTMVNIHPEPATVDWIEMVDGNACALPDTLHGERFDLVYSNSTIEHVGGHAQRVGFAESVHALADRHWIQTPYRYFPIEPHWVCPGFQFLPLAARTTLMKRWPLGPAHRLWQENAERNGGVDSPAAHRSAVEEVLWIELLSDTALRFYFPRSEVVRERFAGITKSLVAVRR